VDLSKVFDTLSHIILLEKLKCCGIIDMEHIWFTDYLFNRKNSVYTIRSIQYHFWSATGLNSGSNIVFTVF